MSEHIVATFDNENAADTAARDLENAGIPASAIRRYRQSQSGAIGASADLSSAPSASTGGFWAWLLGENLPETTRSAYPRDEAWYDQRREAGHAVLSVMVREDSQIHQVVEILDSHHPVEMDESPEEGPTEPAPANNPDVLVASPSPVLGSAPPPPTPGDRRLDSAENSSVTDREEIIPLAEENIEIGKRMIDRGTTRIRRYVVETPIERDVTLHGERVTIERRRPIETGAADHAFEERIVEVRETEEVPVIEKTARVVEEITIRKEETERTQTVRDTVRREEVEVTGKDGERRADS